MLTHSDVPSDGSLIPARVTAVHRERYELVCNRGQTHGRLKAGVYYNGGETPFPTAGDFVLIEDNTGGDSVIVKTLARKTFFSRRDPTPGRGEQAVAANFDYVFILQSLNFDFNLRRLERYLALTWHSGAVPVVLLTKADLVGDDTEQLRAAEKAAAGVGVYSVSAKTGYGLDALSDYLKPRRTIVFLGSSGVGKSSLLNALAGKELMATQDIRQDDSKGRHTTTHRQLIMLPSGAMVIDTPGMRELGMVGSLSSMPMNGMGLDEAFADVEQYFGACRFADCRHGSEPGCAVRAAIRRGELKEERWESYQKLLQEAQYADDKAAFLRAKETRFKEISKTVKKLYKTEGFKK
jgi:ribosome biogenesis GTPase